MRDVRTFLKIISNLLLILVIFALAFILTFFITSAIYQYTGQQPPPFERHMINSLLGFLIGILFFVSLGMFLNSQGWFPKQKRIFERLIQAIEQISKGDFNVRLENDFHNPKPFNELVKSVNNMASELSLMEQMRQEFISNVSHEIQSPITSIRGFAQALQKDDLSLEKRHHYLSIIEAESTRISRITDNLLKLASLESEQARFEPKTYRLDKQIRGNILACEPQWDAKKIDMDISMEKINITADEDLLSQVWTNLIHNSIKFTPTDGKVRITLCQQKNWIEFSISDSGIGISEEDQLHIFERFYKTDRARERSNEGSGLGLSIAKKIIEMHQGNIRVESKPGAGATFYISLPGKEA